MSFKNLELSQPLLKAIKDQGYTTPTPIQQQAIPLVLQGKDLLGIAQTGTGKTAAFGIPLLQRLEESNISGRGIKALILTPTRELAIQIDESLTAYGKYTRLKHTVIFGGVSQNKQVQKLKNGVDILVATPGRLLDLMNQGFISLKHLQIFVLDEADRMLDMGFIHDVKKVIKVLPSKRQTLFFSATMPEEIQSLSNMMLKNPAKVEVTPASSTVDKIQQRIYFTNKPDKRKLLLHLLESNGISSALVFTRTKHGADKVARFLGKAKINSAAIHGNKSQNSRQNALKNFKSGELSVLVATDIAARGIDIDELKHVFNFDLPNVPETYVHRIGRTGRAGNDGMAISFCTSEEKKDLKGIEKLAAIKIPVVEEHPFPLDPNAQPAPAASPKRNRNNRQRRRR
ncbi:ATP-dependent RNA helicase RhlE [Salinimicrobium catena]|uniref:DEAD-box ATP-dependent RNA helicase RhpA n=1 Tax=Salinimicrobium catena TaxID=390640 RepID=A0A1H5NWW6_9FLAO|nr:DEAD/DEAH box helicase [Salinimicrobium catena]SDL59146.1 ATP-dependent RNA helicase RhlE [Salinimicrobium catena]SEF05874.1 ATP-dependent RNA helicase RhlE [Salinimicrobium catena]